MPAIIPLTNDGSRKITITLGENVFIIETYYLPHIQCWIMDIYDIDENPILLGMTLNVGVDNLVKGKSPIFDGQTIRCISINESGNNDALSLGNTCFVIYYAKGEKVPPLFEDKMLG